MLRRPRTLADVASVHVVLQLTHITSSHGQFGVEPYIPGRDLDGLPTGTDLSPLFIQLERALSAAHAQGVGHGCLRPDCIRVTPEGIVRIVDWRGGQPEEDLAQLASLKADLALQDDAETPILPHRLAGKLIAATSTPATDPPKLQMARGAAVTLLLGLFAGGFLGATWLRTPPVHVGISVPGATSIAAICERATATADAPRLYLPTNSGSCAIEADFAEAPSARTDISTKLPGMQTCARSNGDLRCSP